MNIPLTDRHAKALATAFEHWLGPVTLHNVRTRTWASATFVGTRLTMTFAVSPNADVGLFRAEVHEADFALRRAFVADILVIEPEPGSAASSHLTVEVLIVDEA